MKPPDGLKGEARGRLPLSTPPFPDETATSYATRLARLNELDPQLWLPYLVDGMGTFVAASLAAASGYPVRTLKYAMPELCSKTDLKSMRIAGRTRPWANPPGVACRLCAATRGAEQDVWRWHTHEDLVCLRHQRWTHLGTLPFPSRHAQPDLAGQPEILQANRRHRALIRRYGRGEVYSAFASAGKICTRWREAHRHKEGFLRLMESFHGPRWTVDPDHPTIAASAYPQRVALAAILVSPYWRAVADRRRLPRMSWIWDEPYRRWAEPYWRDGPLTEAERAAPSWRDLVEEVRRTVAPHYDDRGARLPLHIWPANEMLLTTLVDLQQRAENPELAAMTPQARSLR